MTDLLVLCIGLAPVDEVVYFLKDGANNKPSVLYSSINNAALQWFILFVHAFVGCYTTNAFFKIGKRSILKLLRDNEELIDLAKKFYELINSFI